MKPQPIIHIAVLTNECCAVFRGNYRLTTEQHCAINGGYDRLHLLPHTRYLDRVLHWQKHSALLLAANDIENRTELGALADGGAHAGGGRDARGLRLVVK